MQPPGCLYKLAQNEMQPKSCLFFLGDTGPCRMVAMRHRPDEQAQGESPAAEGDASPALRSTITNAPPGSSIAGSDTLPAAKEGSAGGVDIPRGQCFGVYRIEGLLAR